MHRIFRKRSLLQSQKLVRHKRVANTLKIIGGILLFVGFIWSLSSITFAPQINITNIHVNGNSAVPSAEIISLTNSVLQGKYLNLISRSNVFWFPRQQIIDELEYTNYWIDT